MEKFREYQDFQASIYTYSPSLPAADSTGLKPWYSGVLVGMGKSICFVLSFEVGCIISNIYPSFNPLLCCFIMSAVD